jgi:hypothetical protein
LTTPRRFALVLGASALLLGVAGCSWLVGVSEDPFVVGDADVDALADADVPDGAEPDAGELDAADDVDVE